MVLKILDSTLYPTERNKNGHHSLMEKVVEQQDEGDEYEIEDEQNQVDRANFNLKLQQFVVRISNGKQGKQQVREAAQNLELPSNEQNSQDFQKKASSQGNSIFQISKDEHPNRAITKQILQISGEEMVACITPQQKSVELNLDDIKGLQKHKSSERSASQNQIDKELKKSKSPKMLKNDAYEVRLLISEPAQDIEQFQQQIKCDQDPYDEQTLIKFQQMRDILNEPVAGWENVTKSDNIYIYKTMKPGKCSVFVKGYALLPGIDKETAFLAIYQSEFRIAWQYKRWQLFFRDKILQGFKIVTRESDLVDIIFYYVSAPVPFFATREFVQKRVLRRDFPEKNQITLLFYSVQNEQQPLKKGNVRAETELAGYLFEDIDGGSQISFISNNDVKGSVPKPLVNYASAKAPFKWFGNLRIACRQYKQFNGDVKKVRIK